MARVHPPIGAADDCGGIRRCIARCRHSGAARFEGRCCGGRGAGGVGYARALCPDRERATIAILAAVALLVWSNAPAQIVIIVAGGMIGWRVLRSGAQRQRQRGWRHLIAAWLSGAGSHSLDCSLRCRWRARHSRSMRSHSSTVSTAPARWSSAAGMSFCRCSTPRSRRPDGSAMRSSSLDMVWRRLCPVRFLHLRHIWGLFRRQRPTDGLEEC